MTTDITELAQRIPERKSHDWSQSVMHDCDFCNQWSLTVKHENGERICASCCDAEYTSKLEVANAELVEALEKAQRYIEELREWNAGLAQESFELQQRIAELESRTVTVKLPDIMPPEAAPAHYWGSGESMAYADGYNKSAADLKTSFAQACSSAGVNVEFE